MKTSKKLKVLAGITRIRVKLGWSQQQLACYLGISKSMVSMIENGNRQIPPAAFLRLCELERLFNTHPELLGEGGAMPVFQESADEKFIRQGREEINRLRLQELQYKLAYMEKTHRSLLEAYQHQEAVIGSTLQYAHPFVLPMMEEARQTLLKEIKRFDERARAKVEGKIAMLELVIASYETEKALEETDELTAKPALINDIPLLLDTVCPTITAKPPLSLDESCIHQTSLPYRAEPCRPESGGLIMKRLAAA